MLQTETGALTCFWRDRPRVLLPILKLLALIAVRLMLTSAIQGHRQEAVRGLDGGAEWDHSMNNSAGSSLQGAHQSNDRTLEVGALPGQEGATTRGQKRALRAAAGASWQGGSFTDAARRAESKGHVPRQVAAPGLPLRSPGPDPRRAVPPGGASLPLEAGGARAGHRYHLSVHIFNRVFAGDEMNVTAYELWQWIEYYRYAGAEHVYWYDTAHTEDEAQEPELALYIESGFMTYHRLRALDHRQLSARQEQGKAMAHYLEHYGGETKWLLSCDIDEYLFMSGDMRPGFLLRYLQQSIDSRPHLKQVLVRNMFFIGSPQVPPPALLIERYLKRKAHASRTGMRTKYMVQPGAVDLRQGGATPGAEDLAAFDPHVMPLRSGMTLHEHPGRLRMNHYWGPRAPAVATTDVKELGEGGVVVVDCGIQPIADAIRPAVDAALESARRRRVEAALRCVEQIAAEVEVALRGLRRWEARIKEEFCGGALP